ncbi:peptidase C14, caspase domain-containing protein [Mycena latifolia]|nr:peptidase C14, caspase domain-containing protein [Mycena latifolia]
MRVGRRLGTPCNPAQSYCNLQVPPMDSRQGSSTGCEADLPTLASPSSPTTLNTGRKRALLVGIRNTSSEGYLELKKAHADVQKIRALLIDIYYYPPADISMLLDDEIDGHVQPTRANILQSIAELVKDAKDGDHLFFHYSGHSTQVDSPRSESEEDAKDECLVPLDGEEMMITGNELEDALIKPLPGGAHLVAVLDSCHSGSLLGLQHHHCTRAPVSWILRGKRTSGDLRDWIVRRGARLLTLAGVQTDKTSESAPAPARSRTRRSIVSVICGPQVPVGRPFARGRSTRIGSLPPKYAAAAAPPEFAKLTWILPEANRRCESPDGSFACNGWCHRAPLADADESTADVISLASCKDSQLTWEDGEGRVSMTSSLADLLRENPNRSLKDVLESVRHATYTAKTRHLDQPWRM